MSSSRFPGKILAPFRGKPLILNLLESVNEVNGINEVVVLTSNDQTDEPLVAYLEKLKYSFYRGSLNNVFQRFQEGLIKYPCDYFVRICADSPLIDRKLIQAMVDIATKSQSDLITNTKGKRFPKGQSIEIIKSQVFASINHLDLNEEELEHVTPYLYKTFDFPRVQYYESNLTMPYEDMCVDTLEDLRRLEHSSSIFRFIEKV
jgi:spore coat polysaccharide biosynthesis protein SpsF (cytidylyltransferase family)